MTPQDDLGASESQEPLSYALRVTPRALADMDTAHAHFWDTAGPEVADDWQETLLKTIAGLAFMPHRQLVPEAKRFQRQVRQIIRVVVQLFSLLTQEWLFLPLGAAVRPLVTIN